MSMTRKRTALVMALAAGVLGTLMIAQSAFATYNKPSGASPFRASFVPAMARCTAAGGAPAGSLHGTPIIAPSCSGATTNNGIPPSPNPGPQRRSTFLTMGTPAGEGGLGGASSQLASVKLTSLFNPDGVGTTDDSDVLIDASITDVRCTQNAAGAPTGQTYVCPANAGVTPGDYPTGSTVRAIAEIRITDKYHAVGAPPTWPAPCGPTPPGAAACSNPASGTVVDIPFTILIPCVGTVATTVGSTCSLAGGTSLDSLCGGCIKEGMRGIVEIGTGTGSTEAGAALNGGGGARIQDGGVDGDATTDATGGVDPAQGAYLRQGIFLP